VDVAAEKKELRGRVKVDEIPSVSFVCCFINMDGRIL
jgi:hypothetical protein